MGYSCTEEAARTEDKIRGICIRETGFQDTFKIKDNLYMYEIGKENDDGSITGSIYKLTETGKYPNGDPKYSGRFASSFRIEPDGTITRFLRFKKEFENKLAEM